MKQEMFIGYFMNEIMNDLDNNINDENSNNLAINTDINNNELNYDMISNVVDKNHKLLFLNDIIPKRMTYNEYKKLIQKQNENQLKMDKNMN